MGYHSYRCEDAACDQNQYRSITAVAIDPDIMSGPELWVSETRTMGGRANELFATYELLSHSIHRTRRATHLFSKRSQVHV